MICPECRQPLSEKEIITSDNQKALVYECFNCGGHFVPPLIANLIPQVTAQDLDSVTPKNTYPVVPSVVCSVCQATMVGITDSEEHTSELQSQSNLVCRLLLEKKKK